MIIELENALKALIAKSAITCDSSDAMRYSQAALNLANAMATLKLNSGYK